jgi:hypothetical protein
MTEDGIRAKYSVYRVFPVSSRPQTVHNLFKLCYPSIS